MSRSGYVEDDGDGDQWAMIRWRGAVASAMRGSKGQSFFREMLAALDALPEPKLVAMELETNGQVCAIGAVGRARGVDMSQLDPEDYSTVAGAFGINEKLAQEIVWMNDDVFSGYRHVKNPETGAYDHFEITPEERFKSMRAWVVKNIKAG